MGKIEGQRMPAEWELVLDLDNDEGLHEGICYYYFVNCSNRTLFWLHTFNVRPLLNGLEDVNSKRRIRESESPTPVLTPLVTVDHRTSVGGMLLVSSCLKPILEVSDRYQETLGNVPPRSRSPRKASERAHRNHDPRRNR